jgi:hypothetical protein
LKAVEPFRVELAQCFDERALPYAGGPAQNHETPFRLRHQSPHMSVLSGPVNPLEVSLRFGKPFVHFYSTFARGLAKICRPLALFNQGIPAREEICTESKSGHPLGCESEAIFGGAKSRK